MKVTKDTDEYTSDEEGELNHSSEEDENQIRKNDVNLRSRSKKVMALRGKIPTNIKDTTGVSSQEKEVEIGNGVQAKKGQSKATVAPGSLTAFRQMKTQLIEKDRRAKQTDLLQRQLKPVNMASSQLVNMASSQVLLGSLQAHSFSQPQRLLQEDYENHMGSNEHNLEQYVDEEDEFSDDLSTLTPEELGMQDEPLMNQEHESEQIALPKRKRTRGPTMCKDVHEWTLEERKLIILNEMGKPIGPDDKTVDTFTRFLGTLARNAFLTPLNKINWHHVTDKEKIWSYVKKKYIIPEEGKDSVLSSVGRLWRNYKCSVNAKHFTPYDNDGDRLADPPNTIPEGHFKDLLEFWNLEQVQDKMEEVQMQSEIDGDVAYYKVMNKPNNLGPKKKQLEICSLRGKSSKVVIPDEFLKPYKDQIVKDTISKLMKTLKKIDPEALDTLTRSLGNMSLNLELTDTFPNVQSNEQEQNEMTDWSSKSRCHKHVRSISS